jgi:hypothetical protein
MRNFLFLIFIILTACSSFEFAMPAPTAEALTVKLSPDLRWIQNSLHSCASTYSEGALFVQADNLDSLQSTEIFISLGLPPGIENFHATLLGHEEIILIMQIPIDINSIDLESIRNAYLSLDTQFQAWAYPSNNQSRQIFDNAMLDNNALSPHVMIAPNPTAMLEAIMNNPRAIGYIPKSWKTDAVQVVSLGTELEDSLLQPVLALSNGEPTGVSKMLLNCLQQALKP